jgi:Putative restriction endonuclease
MPMRDTRPRPLVELEFENAAQAYLRTLTLENHMEGDPQATQRGVSVMSFAYIHKLWNAFQYFNEMLVQYRYGQPPVIRQVVPDNMVVIHSSPIRATTSFNLPLQPCGPTLVLEYVSKDSQRKDYELSFQKYERELKVPYYLIFYPDNEELTLNRLTRRGYRAVHPETTGRYPIPELEMELELLDGWVRYWFRGELVPLAGDMVDQLANERQLRRELACQLKQEQRARQEADRQVEREREARLALERELAELRSRLGQPPSTSE